MGGDAADGVAAAHRIVRGNDDGCRADHCAVDRGGRCVAGRDRGCAHGCSERARIRPVGVWFLWCGGCDIHCARQIQSGESEGPDENDGHRAHESPIQGLMSVRHKLPVLLPALSDKSRHAEELPPQLPDTNVTQKHTTVNHCD